MNSHISRFVFEMFRYDYVSTWYYVLFLKMLVFNSPSLIIIVRNPRENVINSCSVSLQRYAYRSSTPLSGRLVPAAITQINKPAFCSLSLSTHWTIEIRHKGHLHWNLWVRGVT